jgi:hypothetical protein
MNFLEDLTINLDYDEETALHEHQGSPGYEGLILSLGNEWRMERRMSLLPE